jgi:membrane-associated protease RseP (regulator of RpoE activity)
LSTDNPPAAPQRAAEIADEVAAAPTPPDGAMTASQWLRLGGVLALLVWLTTATGIYGLAMVLGLVVMIFLHELGHFVMAKRAGMKVTEFFLGFGPRIWSFHRGETEYGLKLIPAGAYVKIIGMHEIEDVDPADEAQTYRQKPFWQRLGVAVAGSTMHFIMAIGLLYVLLVGFGLPGGAISPDESKWRVSSVSADSAAANAGLRNGDDLVAIDGRPTATFDDLRAQVADRPNEEVTLTVERGGESRAVDVTLGESPTDSRAGFLGVGGAVPVEKLSPIEGVPAAFGEFGTVSVQSVGALGRLFTPSGIADFGGQVADAGSEPEAGGSEGAPSGGDGSTNSSAGAEAEAEGENRLLSLLGVFRIGVDAGASGGWANLVLLFALINVFIGLFNLVPLLPFDGGHVAIALYEKLQEKRQGLSRRYFADVAKLLPLTYVVVIVLGLIFVSTLYLDIRNPLRVN